MYFYFKQIKAYFWENSFLVWLTVVLDEDYILLSLVRYPVTYALGGSPSLVQVLRGGAWYLPPLSPRSQISGFASLRWERGISAQSRVHRPGGVQWWRSVGGVLCFVWSWEMCMRSRVRKVYSMTGYEYIISKKKIQIIRIFFVWQSGLFSEFILRVSEFSRYERISFLVSRYILRSIHLFR